MVSSLLLLLPEPEFSLQLLPGLTPAVAQPFELRRVSRIS